MPARQLYFGEDATDAQWRLADDETSGNFVLAEDTDAGTVLLEYDTTNDEWVTRGPINLTGNDLTDGVTTVWDASAGEVPDAALGTIDNATLANDSVTVTAGDGLQTGGTATLGGSVTVDVDVSDFAGVGLQDDGTENLQLTNDSVTVTAGDGLKNGGTVALGASTTVDIEPADFAGAGLADDGSDNLAIDTVDTGTITASGGSSPAADTTVATSLAQTDAYDVLLYVDADPAFNADYQFNYDYAHQWDDSTSTVSIDWTVNWDVDPGAGNDVTLRWEVIRR